MAKAIHGDCMQFGVWNTTAMFPRGPGRRCAQGQNQHVSCQVSLDNTVLSSSCQTYPSSPRSNVALNLPNPGCLFLPFFSGPRIASPTLPLCLWAASTF